jgi:diguanylate cyclase (GGDEF)-like protein
MELKIYLRVLLRKWWIVLPAFLITLTTTIVLTFTQAPTYETTATFVVAPNGSFEDTRSFVSGLDILSRRAEIATTYAEVAASRLIKREAADELDLSQGQRKNLSVASQLVAGTNVLKITVQGNDPVLVRDFTHMVGTKTMVYVQELYEAYDLNSLDQATLPLSPIKPNKKMNLALGAILGLVLGGGMAFLSEYLQAPLESMTNFDILDSETGAYNRRYFRQRLGEEMSRAERNKYPLSLALMNVDHLEVMGTSFSSQVRSEALRKVAVFLKQHLRQEDVLARLDGTVFAFLLPDMPGEKAQAIMEELQTRMALTSLEVEKSGVKLNLSGATGVAAYPYNGTGQDELLAEANRALQQAEAAGYGKACLLSEKGEDH